MAEGKNIGVYICSGFGIGDALDCEKLAADIKENDSVGHTLVMKNLCTQEGKGQILKDIEEKGLTGLVIAGSSPRFHTEIFNFDNIVMERANIRELVAWTHEPNDEHTFNLAMDYIRMAIAKVQAASLPERMQLDINETVMVVGGGAAGLNAAVAASEGGKSVVLVEKGEELGGFYKKLHKLTPLSGPYMDLETNPVEELIARVESDPKIQVFKNTKITETAGQPGAYDVTAMTAGKETRFQAGAIVQATGWKPYDPKNLEYLGYGKPNVITNVEMEQRAGEGEFTRPSDGKPVNSIVFIQCAGSRDPEHLPYCSTVCCMGSLKQAMYFREKYPDASIYIVYRQLRAFGQYEMFYKRVQNEDNIFLTKGDIQSVEESENGGLAVAVKDSLLGREIELSADMVVLASGLTPSTLVEEKPAKNGNGEEDKNGEEKKEGEEESVMDEAPNADVLHLTYRQGPDLPTLKYGFPDSHYICFPYETRRTGIYAAGTVRQPMDTATAKSDAYGAALKAIQVIESAKEGTAVHPRANEEAYAEFFLQRCTQCKRCTEECPFGTLDEDSKGTPKYNVNRCRRCGICMGACPERIISFKDYSVHIVSQMIKSIYIPTEEEDGDATPRIIAFLCENDAYPSLEMAAAKKMKYSPHIRIIPVRCLGSVNTSWIADSLSQGFDGAILIGCKYGDDYQCHYIKGSELASKRMENVQEKLKQLVLEPERVELHMLSIDEFDKIPGILNKFSETIEEIGANPYKEM